jgi:hypothetical protein
MVQWRALSPRLRESVKRLLSGESPSHLKRFCSVSAYDFPSFLTHSTTVEHFHLVDTLVSVDLETVSNQELPFTTSSVQFKEFTMLSPRGSPINGDLTLELFSRLQYPIGLSRLKYLNVTLRYDTYMFARSAIFSAYRTLRHLCIAFDFDQGSNPYNLIARCSDMQQRTKPSISRAVSY